MFTAQTMLIIQFPTELLFDVRLVLAVIFTFLLTLVLGVSIGLLIVRAVIKYKISENIDVTLQTEMRSPPVIYEEPDAIKPNHIQGNLTYETFQRDPQTEGNVAYGNVSV